MPTVRRFPNLPDVHCSGEALGSPVYWLGLQWAVTADGVERRDGGYVVDRDRIHEVSNGYTWEDHIAAKGWADMQDFRAAMDFARRRWPKRTPAAPIVPPARPGKLVACLDLAIRPGATAARTISLGGALRKAGRVGFVELCRSGPKGRAFAPAEQVLALPVDEIGAAIRILTQARESAVRHGLLDEAGSL